MRVRKQERIRDQVVDLIDSLEVGQAIPSERRLCDQLGVSRLTVRAALDELGVPLHSPVFLFERTTLNDAGRPIEFVRSFYRGDRYQLVTELLPRRSRDGRAPTVPALRTIAGGGE